MIKLTIIGAGSAVFTKNIVVDLMHISQFKKMHISLMDIDEGRLKLAKELIDTVSTNSFANLSLLSSISIKDMCMFLNEEICNKSTTIFLVNTALPAPIIVNLIKNYL